MNVREIASIAFGRAREGILVALRVYLDGAGKEESHPVVTVGGFLAEPNVCEEIEEQWEAATGGRVFHFTDFGHESCKLESNKWKIDERTEFLKKLAAIVNRADCHIVSTSIEVAEFNKILFAAAHPQELGPSSSACAYVTVLNIETALKNAGHQFQPVSYVFEKGDRENEIIKLFADWNEKNSDYRDLRSHAFLPKKTTLLQAADLVAGVVQRCVLSAFNAYPTIGLDNGLARTRLQTFDRHYSTNGVTAAVVSGHDDKRCWVMNAKAFNFLDTIGTNFFTKHPDQLKKSLKRSPYRPKVKNEE
jgi:hypothetical protein